MKKRLNNLKKFYKNSLNLVSMCVNLQCKDTDDLLEAVVVDDDECVLKD